MSEFLAEAQVRVGLEPGASARFRAELLAAVAAASKGVNVTIPVLAVATASQQASAAVAAQAVAAASATSTLAAGHEKAGVSAARQATSELALARASKTSTAAMLGAASASAKLDAGLLGLRTAIGSTAVIGLGALSLAAIAAGLAVRKIIVDTANFEAQLNTFQAVTGAGADTLQRVREQAIALGADTGLAAQSAGDAAVALTELAKAGLSVTDSLAASRGVLQLAGAASIEAGEAATIVATQLNAFGLAGTEATRVVDLLASASIAAQGEITDFALAFQQSATVANQVGVSVEQTTALLTALARAGLRGSDAGTSLRTTLLRLSPSTKEAAKFVAALGVELDNTKSLGEQLPQVIEQYRRGLLALNPVQRTATLNQIFGQDAIRAAAVIFDQTTGALERNVRALSEAGTAAELNAAKARGLKGAFGGLVSQVETAGIEIGSLVDGPLEGLLRQATDNIETIESLTKALFGLKDVQIPPILIPIQFIPGQGDATGGDIAGFLKDSFERGIKQAAPALGTFDFIQELLKKEPVFAEVEFSPDQFGFGSFLADAAEKQKKDVSDAVDRSAKLFGQDKATQKRIADLIAKGGEGGKATSEALAQAAVPLRLSNQVLQAQLAENLQLELQADQQIIDFFQKRLATKDAGTTAFRVIEQALLQAQSAAQSVRDQIKSDAESAARDAEVAAQKVQAERDKADQAFIDILGGRVGRAQNKITIADGTASLQDDINTRITLRNLLQQQIAQVGDTVKDAKVAAQKIAALTTQFISAQQEVKAAFKARNDAAQEAREEREAERRERLSLDTQIAEASGNKNAQLRAIEAEITDLTRLRNAEKRGSVERKRLTLELANKKKELKDLRDETEDANKSATSAFDLLVQASQTFSANAGNLINGNQPFAGPTGFTADLAQFLIRQKTATSGAATPGAAPVGTPGHVRSLDDFRVGIDRLIDALDRNTQATGRGNRTNGTAPGVTLGGLGYRPFRESGGVRAAVEASNV